MDQHNSDIGDMPMPQQFRYAETAARGRPRHERYDPFYIKHPFMEMEKRAKIFSPYDALKGFSDSVRAKETEYVERRILCESDSERLDKRIALLSRLIPDTPSAAAQNITVSVVYFELCRDPNNEAFGKRGRYKRLSGLVGMVDTVFRRILIGKTLLALEDVYCIEGDIFREEERTDK